MNQNIFIFDDFYEDPYKIRKFALNECTFDFTAPKSWEYNSEKVLWPGKATSSTYREKNIDIKISKLMNTVIRTDPDSGFFRLNSENDQPSTYHVHTDGFFGNAVRNKIPRSFTGVIYLTPDQSRYRKGTIFYKHKKTGKIKASNPKELMETSHDFQNIEAWEIYNIVDYKFNRLVLLDVDLFHSIGDSFGTTLNDARLTHIYKFDELL